MIGISKLYCGTVEPSDVLRYSQHNKPLSSHLLQFAIDKKPVVVWNITKACNLRCLHCYAHSSFQPYANELSTSEAKKVIDNLADYSVPVILFSGGEPLMRPDLSELLRYAIKKGIRTVISSNGILINLDKAKEIKELGVSYVGISLDGRRKDVHDYFRGVKNAFNKTLQGIRNCLIAGIKVGLRFTIFKHNLSEILPIFHLIEQEGITRLCFYHLVYTGRGKQLKKEILSHDDTRNVLDLIMDYTKLLLNRGLNYEILTVDNHADGPYVYLRLLRENPERAAKVLKLLQWNGGNSSGVGIGCISWDGSVYPDQFWRHVTLGSVRKKPFSDIWNNINHPILKKLKNRRQYLKGRCALCHWLDICNGNFRARAEVATGDPWGVDPACYLTEKEIFFS